MKTYPNQIAFPRPIGPGEVPKTTVIFSMLAPGETNQLVSVKRFKIEDETNATDLSASASIATNVVTVGRFFLASEKDIPAGVYRIEVKAQKDDGGKVEVANLLFKVGR